LADAATIIPWNMWLAYGDKKILENQYNSMKAWIGFMEKNSTDNLWNKEFHFGDWLFYRPLMITMEDQLLPTNTDCPMLFAHSTRLVIRAAGVLNKKDDEKHIHDLLNKIKQAFIKEYVTPGGRLVSSTQTAYVLALNFDMLPKQCVHLLLKNGSEILKATVHILLLVSWVPLIYVMCFHDLAIRIWRMNYYYRKHILHGCIL
jgi:alpha-L-rhamnosidase